MGKIWQENPWYTALRPYSDMCTVASYRQLEIIGKRSLPKDGALILAPNHTNTLMDALVTLSFSKRPIVFGARADIFSNPFVAKLLTYLRILPMVRRRDGIRKVLQNVETINAVVDVLTNGAPFCIFSEGTHRPKHSLLPINKGVTRIALETIHSIGDTKPVYIVPTGIEYGDYYRYRSTCQLTFGKAINVTQFIKENPDLCEAEIHNRLRALLRDGIASMITYLPDDERYDGRWALLKARTSPLRGIPASRLIKTQAAAAEVLNAPDELLERALAFDSERRAAGISMFSFGRNGLPVKTLIWIALLPIFIAAALSTLPMWATAEWICRNKIKDRAFGNTVRYCCRFFGYLLLPIILAIVLFLTLHWTWALLLLFLYFFALSFTYDYFEFTRRVISHWRLLGRKDLKEEYEELKSAKW